MAKLRALERDAWLERARDATTSKAQHAANPLDDGLREVFADWLIARDDLDTFYDDACDAFLDHMIALGAKRK